MPTPDGMPLPPTQPDQNPQQQQNPDAYSQRPTTALAPRTPNPFAPHPSDQGANPAYSYDYFRGQWTPTGQLTSDMFAASDVNQQQDHLLDELNQRASSMPMEAINDMPNTMSSLLFMPLSTHGVQQIGDMLSRAYPWLKSNMGLSGSMAGAYANALAIQDPEQRKMALTMVQKMAESTSQHYFGVQSFDPQQQAMAVGNEALPRYGEYGGAATAELPGIKVEFDRTIGQATDASIETTNVTSPEFLHAVAMLRYLYGDIPVKGAPKGIEKVFAAADVVTSGIGKGFDAVGAKAAGVPLIGGALRGGLQAAGTGANVLGSIAKFVPTEAAILAGDITHFIPGLPGEKPQLTNPLMPLWPHEFMHGTALGEAWARALNIRPTDPAYQKVVDVGSFIVQMSGYSELAKGFKGFKESGALAQAQAAATEAAGLGPRALGSAGIVGGEELGPEHFGGGVGGRIGSAVYNVLHKTPEEFWRSPLGRGALTRVYDTLQRNPTDAVGELTRTFRPAQVPVGLARAWADSGGTAPELAATAIDYMKGAVDQSYVTQLRGELAGIDQSLRGEPDPLAEAYGAGHPADDPMTKATMLARKASIQSTLADLPESYNAPAWEYPKSTLARRVAQNLPDNGFEQALNMLWNPSTRWLPNASHLFDFLGGRVMIWNPFRGDAPADALDQNAKNIQTLWRRLGAPEAEIDRVISEMSKVTNDQQFREWITKDVEGLTRLDESGSPIAKRLYPRLAYTLSEQRGRSFGERALPAVFKSTEVDGHAVSTRTAVIPRTVYDDLGNAQITDAPWMSAHLLDHYAMPLTQSLLDATSTFRNFTEGLRDRGGYGLAFADTVDWIRNATSVATGILRPATLYPRFPAILMRSQGEQALRNLAVGRRALVLPNFTGVDLLPFENVAQFGADGIPSARDMQGLMGIIVKNGTMSGPRIRSEITSLDSPGILNKRTTEFAWQNMRDLASSGEMKQLVKAGSPEGFVTWLEGDTTAAKLARARFDPILQSSTDFGGDIHAARLQWAQKSLDAIHQITGGNDSLRQAIVSGEWRKLKNVQSTYSPHTAEEYDNLRSDFNDLAHQINKAIGMGDRGLAKELRLQRLEVQQRLLDINNEALRGETRAPGSRTPRIGDRYRTIKIANDKAFQQALEESFRSGEWSPPARLSGLAEDISQKDAARIARRQAQERWYRGMGVAQKADMYLSRGSYYYQRSAELRDQLISRGYKAEDATARASVQGARDTADLHYNLTMRSSAQRYFRNAFWFAPVMQDVLYKWLIKIPSEYSWPAGAAILAGRAEAIVKLTKDLGLIHKDASGNDAVTVPGLGEFLSKITGNKLAPLKDLVTFDPRRLNILGVGSGWRSLTPSLSPQYTIPLNFLANHSKTISDIAGVFEPYGPNTTVGPFALTYAWEAITGKAPTWQIFSDRYQQQQYDLAFDDAIKHAVAESPPPPLRTAYGSDLAYQTAQTNWTNSVQAKAAEVFKGWALIRLLGSTVFPAPLHANDSYKQDAARVLNQLYGTKPPDQGSPAYTAWAERQDQIKNQFLADHPGSIAYLVGKTTPTQANLPYTNNDVSAFYKQLQDGAREALSPDDFLKFVAYEESYRHYIGEKQQVIKSLGGTAPAILANGFEKKTAFDSINKDWNQYQWLNGDAKYLYDTRLRLLVKSGQVPVSAFETERVSTTLQTLFDTASATANGGIRDQDLMKAYYKMEQANTKSYGAPRTEIEKGLAWYFKSVLDPYHKELDPLYSKRDKIKSSGGDTSAISNQITQVLNKWDGKTFTGPDGLKYPSPQAVTWGNRTAVEQRIAKITWATLPVGWLSNFQLSKAGFNVKDVPKANVFFGEQAKTDAFLKTWIAKYNVSPGSKYYQTLQQWRNNLLGQAAGKAGPEVQHLWQLDQATPAQRLAVLNKPFGQNQTFKDAINLVSQIDKVIVGAKESPKGFGRDAEFYKAWLFPILSQAETKDHQFRQLMEDASLALKNNPTGAALYDQLFFDGFGPLPPALTQAAPGSTNLAQSPGVTPQQWTQQYQNGQIPQGAMSPIGGNHYMAPFAASAYENMVKAAANAGVIWQVDSAYRDLAQQEQLYQAYLNGGTLAAPPGSSEHGWGIAVDLGTNAQSYAWLQQNAGSFGFQQTVAGESWHWAYVGG